MNMKNTTTRVIIILAMCTLLTLICVITAVSVSAETEIERIEVLGTFDIEAGMTVPEDIRVPEDAHYTVEAFWYYYDDDGEMVTATGTFELGQYYNLDLAFIPEEGYCFPDRSIYLDLNGEIYDTVWPNSHLAVYYFYFDLSPAIREASVSYSDISAGMNTAQTQLSIPEDVMYTASYEWKRYNEMQGEYEPYSGILSEGYKYCLVLNLTSADGWYFDTYNISLTVNGEYVWAYPYDGVLSYEAEIDMRSQIESVYLIGVSEPAVGGIATVEGITVPQNAPYTLESVRYATLNRDYWAYDDFSGVFELGTEYTLIACFKAADGYTFADNYIDVYINGEYIDYCTGEEGYLYFYRDYKITRPIDRIDVAGVVDTVVGGVASTDGITAASDSPYAVTYCYWNEYEKGKGYKRFDGQTFRSGMKYELAINVNITNSEYSFAEGAQVYVNGEPAHVATVYDDSIYIYQHTATAPTVSEVGIMGFNMPEYGASTSLSGVSAIGEGYFISEIRWVEEYGEDEWAEVCSPTFTEGFRYTLVIHFGLEDEYFFSHDCIFTINGVEFDYYQKGNEYFSVSYTFDLDQDPDQPEQTEGDIDGDGMLTSSDITLFVRQLCGWTEEADTSLLDIDGNGRINNRDIIALIIMIAQ